MSKNLVSRPELIESTGTLGIQADVYTNSLTKNTRRAYTTDVCEFFGVSDLNQVPLHQVQSVTVASAMEFRDRLLAEGKALSTINRKLTSLSAFYTFLSRHEVGIMEYNPFSAKEGLARMRQNKRYSNTRCLTVDEVQMLVRVTMEGDDLEALRNRIIVLLFATTGMRRAEIVHILLGQIRRSHGKDIIEIQGKGDKERIIVISPTIKVMIDNYIKMRGLTYENKDHYLLASHTSNARHFEEESQEPKPISTQTVYNVIKKVAERAGIHADDVSPHCLRHTWFTEALESGIPIQDVADMGGHSDLSTTRRYDHTKRVIKNNPADMLTNKFLGMAD
ncbi:tyrosine-type recombinase/integrase [Paenibacillus chitinolyticus]|uniref:tyrosine-type recombinase/integrase n=1 Tax=Paenibacillus chitinolyticus TaxID=79263 RepID=UPI003D016AFD